MKKFNLLLMALGGALILSLGSCGDDCDDVTCENGGTCDEGDCTCADNYYGELCADYCVNGDYSSGNCNCDAGYEGDACTTESRTKFYGTYNTSGSVVCSETGSGTVSFTTAFSASSVSAELMLINIGGGALNFTATVDGSTFTINEATINGFTYTGGGSIVGTTVSISFNEYDPSVPETCVYSMSGSIQ